MSNEHLFSTRQLRVATVPSVNFVNRQISFQNRVRWLGGRFSNSPPSAIPGRWQIVSRRLILRGAWLNLCRPKDSVTLTNPLKAAPVLGALLAGATYTPESQLTLGATENHLPTLVFMKLGLTEVQCAFV